MAAVEPAYEEFRKQRLEENRRRMQELNLAALSQTLKKSCPKPSPSKYCKPKTPRIDMGLVEVRRSSRVAAMPAASYKEVKYEYMEMPRRIYKRRALLDRSHISDGARTKAIERAEVLQSNLEPIYPSFVKPMLHSHVKVGFWLGLPVGFCKSNLPKNDAIITLEDEDCNEFQTNFLAQKTGLSAGWRGFAIDHELNDGDAVVFQLVKPLKFKVMIWLSASVIALVDLFKALHSSQPKVIVVAY
ncbi:hypothetical protein AMTR_s00059p00130960 [Amborella trichopoda]|uniref:TF-B3 domain-containing protein n=1 Tax=Amborella trichopoda TaxID=13333 RepID=U5D833_AMBTC|nr:hypothetical protein AMTR_s00059p00130960 [Amborella trichopoda]